MAIISILIIVVKPALKQQYSTVILWTEIPIITHDFLISLLGSHCVGSSSVYSFTQYYETR